MTISILFERFRVFARSMDPKWDAVRLLPADAVGWTDASADVQPRITRPLATRQDFGASWDLASGQTMSSKSESRSGVSRSEVRILDGFKSGLLPIRRQSGKKIADVLFKFLGLVEVQVVLRGG
jgi:hypothetical protein